MHARRSGLVSGQLCAFVGAGFMLGAVKREYVVFVGGGACEDVVRGICTIVEVFALHRNKAREGRGRV
eukprot:7204568-Prorocentrum_lima.AAC.1